MNLLDASLRQLGYLRAVARETSFAAAADEVGVSQSALSQGLARLEALAGVELLVADGRRKRLNRHGQMLAEMAERVLAEAAAVGERLQAAAAGRSGTLRVAMIDAAALYLFPDRLERFETDHPDVALRITVETSAGCLELLGRFEVDVAVVVGPAAGFSTRPLVTETLFLYGPAPEPDPAGPWLLYPSGSHTRTLIDAALAEAGIPPRVTAESGNPAVLYQLAALMGGWTVLPEPVGGGGGGRLRRFDPVTERPVVAARRPGASDPLADHLVAALGGG